MTGGALSQQIAGIDTACCANESRLGGRKLNYDEWERPLTTGKKTLQQKWGSWKDNLFFNFRLKINDIWKDQREQARELNREINAKTLLVKSV